MKNGIVFLILYRGLGHPAEDLVSSTSSIMPEEIHISSVYPITLSMFGQEIDEQIFRIDVPNPRSSTKASSEVSQQPKRTIPSRYLLSQ
ncbi:MAG: hypothetical protein ACREV1_15715 [Gammaproteobacteria bacterium]